MRIEWMTIFADVPADRLDKAAAFWSAATGAVRRDPTGDDGEFTPLDPPTGDSYLWLQRIGSGEPRWHLDLHADDLEQATRHATGLGATITQKRQGLTVLATPAGQPFCIVGEPGARRRPQPARWPSGSSLLDQLCLDLPADTFDGEAAFWSAFTGLPRRHGTLPEFEHLPRRDRLPIRILLQRLGTDDPGPARAHADFSADDVTAECERHVELGARIERINEHWTVMRDPVGLTYCVTDRSPNQPNTPSGS